MQLGWGIGRTSALLKAWFAVDRQGGVLGNGIPCVALVKPNHRLTCENGLQGMREEADVQVKSWDSHGE